MNFWAGRKVFLTGHTGFKGGWLGVWLTKMGAEVTGYSLTPPTKPSFFQYMLGCAAKHSVMDDVLHLDALKRAMKDAEPEIVFHLAAQPLVLEGYRTPAETYATNVMGTVNVLEAVRATPSVSAAVVVTSDKCYDNHDQHEAFKEGDALGGRDPYSSSKACAELVVNAYRESFLAEKGIAVATARAGNVIGGGDWTPWRIVPELVAAFVREQPPILRRASAVRPWQHAMDPLAGYLLLGERLLEHGTQYGGAYTQAWNFGPKAQDAITVAELAERAARAWGADTKIVHGDATEREAAVLRIDSSHAKQGLGWETKWGIDRAVAETMAWYRAWHAGECMREFTLKQIEAFEAS